VQPRGPIERQRLTIDIGSLEPGEWSLTVEVHDTAGGPPAVRSVIFSIPERAAQRAARSGRP
jgi:hypothetical protein